jgi:hypothetical protein
MKVDTQIGRQPRKRLTQEQQRAMYSSAGPDQDSPHASSVIHYLDQLRRGGQTLLAVAYMRSSTREQRKRQNLRNRLRWIRRQLRERGVERLKTFREVADGRFLDDRQELRNAVEFALAGQSENPDALVIVVTDTRNRFIRGRFFNGQAATDPPSATQLRELAALARGVPLATVLHPDTPAGAVRGYETKIPDIMGEASGKKVGRPTGPSRCAGYKRKRRERLLPEISRLHFYDELSIREVARRLGQSESTVRGWLKRPRP